MYFAFFFVMYSCGFKERKKESNSIFTVKLERREHTKRKEKRGKKHISWKEKKGKVKRLFLLEEKRSTKFASASKKGK